MADGAFIERACVLLKLEKLDRIIQLPAGRDGMRAVMAGFAIHTTVTFRKTVQGLVLVILMGIRRHMASITAWLIQPWVGIGCHLRYISMTRDARHIKVLRHHIPQALRDRARMAVIATI